MYGKDPPYQANKWVFVNIEEHDSSAARVKLMLRCLQIIYYKCLLAYFRRGIVEGLRDSSDISHHIEALLIKYS